MSNIIKNIPKTTKEALNELIEPYIGPKPVLDDDNRGYDISVKDDMFKDISIGFEDITEAIIYYFRNVIKLSVIENGNSVDIPIIYADPERWKSAQRDGFIRDKEGRAMYPIVSIKRDSIEKRRDLGNKLDGNNSHLYQTYQTSFSRKNSYDNFSVLTNRIPVKEFRTIVVPDYYNIMYSCTVYVNYMSDLDDILESIGFASDSYWGDRERFHFMTRIDSMPTIQQISQGEDRIISSTFTLNLSGYILPKSINKEMATKNKFISKAQVIFNSETISGLGVDTPVIKNSSMNTGGNTYKPVTNINNVITYMSINKEKTAVNVIGDVAIFNASFLIAPVSLPNTSIDNFTFFINSAYVEKTAISSFIDNGNGTCSLTISQSELGYSISTDDEIIAIGKFQ